MRDISSARRSAAFVSDAQPERNGVGAYYRDLVDQLESSGISARLVCPDDPERELLSVPLPGDSTQHLSLPSPRQLYLRLKRLSPNTIVVATPGPYGILGAKIGRRMGARVLIGFHTHFEKLVDLYWQSIFGRISRRYLEASNRFLFRQGSVVLANSEEMMEVARRLGARDVRLVGTLLAQPFLQRPATPPRPALARVLFAGRLAPEKNIQAIVAAAESLPELRFSIAGDGPQRAYVDEAAARLPNLSALGWLSRSQLVTEMDEHDLLVLPSLVESFGTVGIEAMARERLLLVSAQCGMVQWPSLTPAIYQYGSGESLAQAVERIAGLSAAERLRKADRARNAALELNAHSLGDWVRLLEPDAPLQPQGA